MPEQRIAIIGGGAKAAAVAAKAHCLREMGIPIQVTIFEKHEVGAAWNGRRGYTDGEQRLCTAAERDLGFPYARSFDPEVQRLMLDRFSWPAFKVDRTAQGAGLSDWVNRGRKPATHAEFADYLAWAVENSESEVVAGEVTAVRQEGDLWEIDYREAASGQELSVTEGFHGVVVTGPGPAKPLATTLKHGKLLNGVDFWARPQDVRRALRSGSKTVAILGGGGTAAAIAAWLVQNVSVNHSIMFINSQAMLFTRTASFFEGRLFDDTETWLSLTVEDRRNFTTRLNRGVVWEAVTDILSDANNVVLLPGRVKSVTAIDPPQGDNSLLNVTYGNSHGDLDLSADLVVDATGFDAWWFKSLFDDAIWQGHGKTPAELEEGMNDDLSFDLPGLPPLHAPMHSQVVGPGFVSLMVLGDLSDRILSSYVRKAQDP